MAASRHHPRWTFGFVLLATVDAWAGGPRPACARGAHTFVRGMAVVAPPPSLRAHASTRRSRVVAFDAQSGVQTFRDAWSMAGDIVLSRTVAFIAANVIATLAWRGISGALEGATPKPARKSSAATRDELGAAASTRAREVPLQQWLKLIPCVLIDLGGDASYALPFVGDIGDVTWAPTSALLLKQLFGSNAIAGVDFVKEILPFTDIIPVATIAWTLETFAPDSAAAKALGIKPPVE